jgi:hypothetical protein
MKKLQVLERKWPLTKNLPSGLNIVTRSIYKIGIFLKCSPDMVNPLKFQVHLLMFKSLLPYFSMHKLGMHTPYSQRPKSGQVWYSDHRY